MADGSSMPYMACWPHHWLYPKALELCSGPNALPEHVVAFVDAAWRQERAVQILRGVEEVTLVGERGRQCKHAFCKCQGLINVALTAAICSSCVPLP